jgi:hypothetical protein
MTPRNLSLEERFWLHVRKSTGCWIWTAQIHGFGYGYFHVGKRKMPAHRFSWELHYGKIPEGLFVCHHCDVPECVNPDHLFLGTKKQNTHDAIRKGRLFHKISSQQVDEIRCSSLSCRKLSEIYGIGRSQISNIKRGASRKYIEGIQHETS